VIDQIFGIGRLAQAREVKRVAKAGATGGSHFAQHLEGTQGPDELSGTTATQPLSATSFVIGAQEVDDALARASRGKARAEDILKMLDDLRLEMLYGQVTKGRLLALSQSLQQHRPQITDVRLAGVLDEIDLRAKVELAKFEAAGHH